MEKIENTVWTAACLVDEKGIRFESGTTAITVFDKAKGMTIGFSEKGSFARGAATAS